MSEKSKKIINQKWRDFFKSEQNFLEEIVPRHAKSVFVFDDMPAKYLRHDKNMVPLDYPRAPTFIRNIFVCHTNNDYKNLISEFDIVIEKFRTAAIFEKRSKMSDEENQKTSDDNIKTPHPRRFPNFINASVSSIIVNKSSSTKSQPLKNFVRKDVLSIKRYKANTDADIARFEIDAAHDQKLLADVGVCARIGMYELFVDVNDLFSFAIRQFNIDDNDADLYRLQHRKSTGHRYKMRYVEDQKSYKSNFGFVIVRDIDTNINRNNALEQLVSVSSERQRRADADQSQYNMIVLPIDHDFFGTIHLIKK